jgi:pimeloyl-ACP methyl ester carboxylesterase
MTSLHPPITDVIATATGQRLMVGEWPGDEPGFIFAPGLTSTHRNIAGVAAAANGRMRIVALDLRGRGCSTKPPAGQYGMERHADDVIAVMDALGIERAIVGGHSMGAYVATAVATRVPGRVKGLALIDGGVRLEVPAGTDADALLGLLLGPLMERLRTTYKSVTEYREEWYSQPYVEPNPIADQYLLYDLGLTREGYRPKCSYEAALEDWRDLINNPATIERLKDIRCPVLAIGAETGIRPDQPSILSEAHLTRLREAIGSFDFVRVPGTTHHSVTLSAQGAGAVAEALCRFAERLR